MRGDGKCRVLAQGLMQCDQEQALAKLRNTVVRSIQQRVSALVTPSGKGGADLLRDIVSAVVQDVGNILQNDGQWFERANVLEETTIEAGAWVFAVGLRIVRDGAQFRAPDAGKSLTRQSRENHINRARYAS